MPQEIERLNSQLNHLEINNWLHHDLFTYQWWIILVLNATFFGLLLIFMDRKRIFQLGLAYMICFLLVCISDDIGEYFSLWSYSHQLIPFITEFDAVEFVVIPATFTLIYQKFHLWKNYIISALIVSAAYAFVGLPIFVYLNITNLIHWNYFYSFLVLAVNCLLVKLIMDYISEINLKLKQRDYKNPKTTFNPFQSKKKAR